MKWRQSGVLRTLLAVFAVLALLLAVGAGVLSLGMYNWNVYTSTCEYLERETTDSLLRAQLEDALRAYGRGDDPAALYADTNLIFRLTDGVTGETLSQSAAQSFPAGANTVTVEWYGYAPDSNERIMLRAAEGCVDPALPHADRYSLILGGLRAAYALRYAMPFFACGGVVLYIVLLIFLMCAAGYRRGSEEARPGWFDRFPLDVLLTLYFFAAGMGIVLISESSAWMLLAVSAALCVLFAILLTALLASVAVRVKTHTIWRANLIWYVFSFAGRGLRAAWRECGKFLRVLPQAWKTALCILADLFFDLVICWLGQGRGGILSLLLWKDLILGALLCIAVSYLKRIRAAGARLAAGKMEAKVDTRGMRGEMLAFAEDMNRVGDGMSAAVEERMKSERFRTELITNVSHDIKTPLTSIVNYVDLIRKENVTEEPLCGYVEVLARQSARLKKLTEDLIEVSKAATGNIPVHLEPCDAGVLLEQLGGEYAERMDAAALTWIVTHPEEPLTILADGRLLWRVLDNLMNNILKYAMPATRVYCTLERQEKTARFTFRNISRDPLNVPGEELLERFTRGDSARSTEGSGLGLAIANSLTELQGGALTLSVDGDLFKVELDFPLAPDGE